jgi:hypothetical protein
VGIPVVSWNELSQEEYDAAFNRAAQIVVERFPELRVRRGVIHDIVLTLHGALGAVRAVEYDRFIQH